MKKKKNWQEQHPNRICYVDDYSFENIKLVYLAPLTTSTCQPSDMAYYANLQGQFKRWFNLQNDKNTVNRKQKIEKV